MRRAGSWETNAQPIRRPYLFRSSRDGRRSPEISDSGTEFRSELNVAPPGDGGALPDKLDVLIAERETKAIAECRPDQSPRWVIIIASCRSQCSGRPYPGSDLIADTARDRESALEEQAQRAVRLVQLPCSTTRFRPGGAHSHIRSLVVSVPHDHVSPLRCRLRRTLPMGCDTRLVLA